ncbi:hypothetical protein BRADI_1g26015v3 [Brachypodium distachyon]|uniref:Uncharacterized protein n=1 Tax=Brachypodium distachyon TaxID=15368 RepID=A0A2K2DL36_BRADI|nr:hypothetical protein BRADI_1g26015v3 [Brachypodium distachyon]
MRLGQFRPHRGVSAARSSRIRLSGSGMVIQPSSSSSSLGRWFVSQITVADVFCLRPAAMSTTVFWLQRGLEVQRQHGTSLTARQWRVQEEDNDVYVQ